MTPQEALNLLTQATSVIEANRHTHDKVREALNVFKELIPKDEPVDTTG